LFLVSEPKVFLPGAGNFKNRKTEYRCKVYTCLLYPNGEKQKICVNKATAVKNGR